MELRSLLQLAYFGATTILFKRKRPLVGSIILTDKCNLACKHCAVSNITSIIYPYPQIRAEMQWLYAEGVRILFFYGGEPFLWRNQGHTLRDLVIEAKQIGFLLVNVVTNGTLQVGLPEADLVMVSLDGGKEKHNEIRGESYDRIIANIEKASRENVCLYMAINQVNKGEVGAVCETAVHTKNVKAVSFNFHTPYPGTEWLKLSRTEKQACADQIAELIDAGYPILNLKSALPYIVDNTFPTPCYQCIVVENGEKWVCGRCIDIEGLCAECGFFFAAEFSLLFKGNVKVMWDLFRTYLKYI